MLQYSERTVPICALTSMFQILASPHPRQDLVFAVIQACIVVLGVRSYLTMVLFCVPLKITEVEHLFTYLLVPGTSYEVFESFAHFSIV